MNFADLYQVGDRVVALGEIDNLDLSGLEGLVIRVDECSLGIEFDKSFGGGHDCGKRGRYGHCRWCYNMSEVQHVEAEQKDIEPDEDEISILNTFLSNFIKEAKYDK